MSEFEASPVFAESPAEGFTSTPEAESTPFAEPVAPVSTAPASGDDVPLEQLPGFDLLVPMDSLPLGDALRLTAFYEDMAGTGSLSSQANALANLVDNAEALFVREDKRGEWRKFAVGKNFKKATELLMAYLGELGNG